jgi:membrane protease YdiL (CAAX protease family)
LDYLDPIPQNDPALFPPVAPVPVDDRKNAVVDLLDVLMVVVVTLAAYVVCGAVAIGIFLSRHSSFRIDSPSLTKALEHNVFFLLPVQLAVYAMVVGSMAFLVWVRHRTEFGPAIRWNAPKLNRALMALLGGVALALLADAADLLLHRWIPKSLPITELFKDRSSAFALAAFGIMIAPLVEELFFRGFLYPALARWTGVVPAVAITGAAFALLHEGQLARAWAPLLVLFVVGTVLTVVRAAGKSVAVCVLVHMAYNLTLFTQLYIGSDGFRHLQD